MTTEAKTTALALGNRGFELSTIDEAFRFAKYVRASGLAPSSFKSEAAVIIAIQCGKEIGLPPMMAMSTICVVNGVPSLWGQALPALAHQSGIIEPDGIQEWFERGGKRLSPQDEAGPIGDDWVACCRTIRKGQKDGVTRRFSVSDAKTAGLWGKAGPWRQYPKDMLRYKARARSFRANLPDVLMGLAIKEDIEDIEIKTVVNVADRAPDSPPPEPDPLLGGLLNSDSGDTSGRIQGSNQRKIRTYGKNETPKCALEPDVQTAQSEDSELKPPSEAGNGDQKTAKVMDRGSERATRSMSRIQNIRANSGGTGKTGKRQTSSPESSSKPKVGNISFDRDGTIKEIESVITGCTNLKPRQKTIATRCLGHHWRTCVPQVLIDGLEWVKRVSAALEESGPPETDDAFLKLIDDCKPVKTEV